MNVKGTHARTGAFALIWLPTIPVNAQGSTWGGTVSTVSTLLFFSSHSMQVVTQQPGSISAEQSDPFLKSCLVKSCHD